jgi:hypothetical protein
VVAAVRFDFRKTLMGQCPEKNQIDSRYELGPISLGKMGTSLPYLVGPASRLTRLVADASDEDVPNPYRFQGIEVTGT